MFDAPYEVLMSPVMDPPNGTIAVISTTSPEQVWFYICVPILLVVPAIFVALRAYTKIKLIRKYDWSDFMILTALIIFTINVGMAKIELSYGIGVHIWNLRYYDYMRMLFWLNITEAVWGPLVFFVKTPIVLQYMAILCPTRTLNRFVFYGGWSMIAAMFLFYFPDIFITLFFCNPRKKIWNYLAEGTCMNYPLCIVSGSVFNILSDVAILLLPVKSLWNLRITRRKKLLILTLFATGLLATFASAMRIYYIMILHGQGDRQDTSYELAWIGLWAWAEIALGIICACSLSLPKVWREKRSEIQAFLSKISKLFVPLGRALSGLISKNRGDSSKLQPETASENLSLCERQDPVLVLETWPQVDDAGSLSGSGSRTEL